MSNFPSGAGGASVLIYSGLGRERNGIRAILSEHVGCRFENCGYRRVRVCKIRPVQDSLYHVWTKALLHIQVVEKSIILCIKLLMRNGNVKENIVTNKKISK